MKSSKSIRQLFIDFFEAKKHQLVSASPVVPQADPTLLFINAGMNQFKDVFLGTGTRDYKRAVNSQPCIRVSGKHNDLEDVGFDGTHLTLFEMLGNWSFGDYYKKEAIVWAWEFLTNVLSIDKSKLVATVFEDDAESFDLWKTHTDIHARQIVTCDAKDNFWEMGSIGPCGPCSEIHVYLKDEKLPLKLDQATINNGDFIELWNLVFIQYNRIENGDLDVLPEKHVDTGAGFERLVAYLQGTSSNYETDLFKPIIKKIEDLSGKPYHAGELGIPHRVCADHIRTLCFGIADNVLLSNEGRGYVLRRLLRRACRYAKKLGFDKPILFELVDVVVDTLGDVYEQLAERKTYIKQLVKAEEESFLATLQSGLLRFEELAIECVKNNQSKIEGNDAFKLYDTYGFPIDLTAVLAQEQGLTVDNLGFESCLNQQRDRSRKAAQFDAGKSIQSKFVTAEMFDGCQLHLASDLNVAKGGEARIIANPEEKVAMAKHHSATHILHHCLRNTLGLHVQQAGSLVDSDRLRFDFSHFEKVSAETLANIELKANEMVANKLMINVSHTTLDLAKKKGAIALFGEKYDLDNVRVVNIGNESIECCAGTHVTNTDQIECIKIIMESAISAGSRRIEAVAGNTAVQAYLDGILQSKKEQLSQQVTQLRELNKQSLDKQSATIKVLEQDYMSLDISKKEDLIHRINQELVYVKEKLKTEKKQQKNIGNQTDKQLVIELKNEIKQSEKVDYVVKIIPNTNVGRLRIIADQLVASNQRCAVVLLTEHKSQGQLVIKFGKQLNEPKFNAADWVTIITKSYGGGGGGRASMAQAGGIQTSNLEMVVTFIESELVS